MGDLQARLRSAEAGGRRDEVDRLRGRLASAAQALTTQQAAALVDYRAIYDANHRAIALIWAEFGPGDVQMGTAFAVRQDGMLVTNRHVVQGPQGDRRPLRVAIQFTHSDQVWPATLVGSSAEADVAVVRVDGIRGAVPAIAVPPSAPPLRPGDPVATIGFPFGTDLPMRSSGEGNVVRATLTAGLVSKVLPDEVQIDGYGAQGASGSPVFDREGRLVGVLYGGEAGTNGRIVYLVPVNSVTTLLRRLGVSSPG
jgi:serine protease Do